MEEFNTQICTTVEQSQKLISFGLKAETADMYWYVTPKESILCVFGNLGEHCIPAWSLHRLIKMAFHKGIGIVVADNTFDSIISLIEKRIKVGVFNKEYLCDLKEV